MTFDLPATGSTSSIGKKFTANSLSMENYFAEPANDLLMNSTANSLFQPGNKDTFSNPYNSTRASSGLSEKDYLRNHGPSLQTKDLYNNKEMSAIYSSSRHQSNDIFGTEKSGSLGFSRLPEKDVLSQNGPMSFYNHSRSINSVPIGSEGGGISSLLGTQSNSDQPPSQGSRLPAFQSVGQTSPNNRSGMNNAVPGSQNSLVSSVQPTIGSSGVGSTVSGSASTRAMLNHLTNSSTGFTSPSRMSPNLSHMQQGYGFSGGSSLSAKQRSISPSMAAFANPFNVPGRGNAQGFGSISPANLQQNSLGLSGPDSLGQKPTAFDIQDFPALSKHNQLGDMGTTATRNTTYGMASKVGGEHVNNDFSIQNEDFPALPGSGIRPKPAGMSSFQGTAMDNYSHPVNDEAHFAQQYGASNFRPEKTEANSSGGPFDLMKKQTGIQTYGDGLVTNIPPGMVTDQFGIVGLLTFIRAAERDSNLVALALGSDLQNLGLNLTSQDLFSTFQSPFAETPCRPQDIDFFVPSEYLTNLHIRDRLAPIRLSKYAEDTLFYLFYTNINDVLQLAAAAELFAQDWRYHKSEKMWLTRAPGYNATKFETYEQGTYLFFDPKQWRKVPREFRLEYDKLEERPQLPTSLNYHPAHSQVH